MSNRVSKVLSVAIATLAFCSAALAQTGRPAPASVSPAPVQTVANGPSDRERDGLMGPVRKIKTEVAKLTSKAGKPTEGANVLLETAAYDIKGTKVDTAYFPVAGANLTGRETYKYDDKGNISEMTLLNADGSIMTREVYKYEYDFVGNWTTMTTSVAILEGGKISFDPSEVTKRTISYYLDDKLTKMMEASQKPAAAPVTPANTAAAQPKPAGTNPVGTNTVGPNTVASQPKPANTGTNTPDANNPQNTSANHVVETKVPDSKPAAVPSTDLSAAVKPADSNANNAATGSTGTPDDKGGPASAPAATETAKVLPRPLTKPISGGVLNGAAISLPTPSYPDVARRSRAGGLVVVEVIIDEDGRVITAKATSGPVMLYNAAIDAAKRARFSPTKLSGQPVKVAGTINYNFSLGN